MSSIFTVAYVVFIEQFVKKLTEKKMNFIKQKIVRYAK